MIVSLYPFFGSGERGRAWIRFLRILKIKYGLNLVSRLKAASLKPNAYHFLKTKPISVIL
jgi:hypothetical protein